MDIARTIFGIMGITISIPCLIVGLQCLGDFRMRKRERMSYFCAGLMAINAAFVSGFLGAVMLIYEYQFVLKSFLHKLFGG